ncbi:VOC family protein [Paenibacillus sp. FSL R7-0312]|uniref:VOC family protein n=1 Tax=unclassified Paenibacillus TaxID=185978 RepID=UPI0004F8C114|nr:VOC family protein [Paenibacillus sp. FSL R5-0912]AIQ42319.1 hypothetical protein R50912_21470 [Paenibacillus sp. FSL R5-0912]
MKLGAIALCVDDMEKMVRFYRDLMRMELDYDGGGFTGVRTAGGIYFNLCERALFESQLSRKFDYPGGLNGTMEITFGVPHFTDVDLEYDRLIEAGVQPVYPPTTEPYGLRICYVADPEGNLIEICSDGKGE